MRTSVLIAVLLSPLANVAHAAPSPDVIQRLVAQGNIDGALRKCEAWNAQARGSEASLREACAAADWEQTSLVGTVRAWAEYRTRWAGTQKAEAAKAVEAQKALLALGMSAGEQPLLELARAYEGTPVADEARRRAAQAAFRTVRTPDDALKAVRAYPKEPEAIDLTQRYLDAFVNIAFTEKGADVSLNDAAVVPEGKELGTMWVVRGASGAYAAWPDQLRERLIAAGLSEDYVAARLATYAEGGERLPVCFDGGLAEGAQVGVLVTLGRGTTFAAAPWDKGCGPDAAPILVGKRDGVVTSLGFGPGHTVELPHAGSDLKLPGGAQLLVPAAVEAPVIVGGLVAQAAGPGLFLATSLETGSTWWLATQQPPPGTALRLSGELAGAALPEGWRMSSTGDKTVVRTPNSDEPWIIEAPSVVTLSPLVQQVTGLHPLPAFPALPSLTAPTTSPWLLPPASGTVDPNARFGPSGSERVELIKLDATGVQRVAGAIEATGVAVVVAEAYSVQLDDDALMEAIAAVTIDGRPAVVLLDPPAQGLTRVLPFVRADGPVRGDTPGVWFAYRSAGVTHVAWSVHSSEGDRLLDLAGGSAIALRSFPMPMTVQGR